MGMPMRLTLREWETGTLTPRGSRRITLAMPILAIGLTLLLSSACSRESGDQAESPSSSSPGVQRTSGDAAHDYGGMTPLEDLCSSNAPRGIVDSDGDMVANECDTDDDDDGVADASDDCPLSMGLSIDSSGCADEQVDPDADGICDPSAPSDGPSECTGSDNCSLEANTSQTDSDEDLVGDACDNCPSDSNDQLDSDEDGEGDACDSDSDGDEVSDSTDNCPSFPNEGQDDGDSDDLGDECDNCPTVSNASQANSDEDNRGDDCDSCPADTDYGDEDMDSDGVGDICDICIDVENEAQEDDDGDLWGDECDNCPSVQNPIQADTDDDGEGDECEGDEGLRRLTILSDRMTPQVQGTAEDPTADALAIGKYK